MTKIGDRTYGRWPERPVEPKIGMWVRFPVGGKIARGKIIALSGDTALLEGGRWAYTSELSEDRD